MTAFKWNTAEYNNYRDKYSILSASLDLYLFQIVLDSLPVVEDILELGTYTGGALIFLNEVLKKKNINAQFTAVDHIAWANNFSAFAWKNHASRVLPPQSFNSFLSIKTADDAAHWLKNRCKEVSGQDIDVRWLLNENELDDKKYNVIFHDYGQTAEENTATLDKCWPRLRDDGIYVIDDFETAQPYRVIATIEAMQQGKLFPVLWGSKKVFFANNIDFAKTLIDKIKINSNFEEYVVGTYVNFKSIHGTYNPLKVKLTTIQ